MDAFGRLKKAISKMEVVMRTDKAECANWILKAGGIFKNT